MIGLLVAAVGVSVLGSVGVGAGEHPVAIRGTTCHVSHKEHLDSFRQ